MWLIIPSLISVCLAATPPEPTPEPTLAEDCQYNGYAYADEKFGPFQGVEFNFQNASCNGAGHTRFAVSIVARDAKSKKTIDTFNEDWMGDGTSLAPVKYLNGVFLYSHGLRSDELEIISRFDYATRKFKNVPFAKDTLVNEKTQAKALKSQRHSSSNFVHTLQTLEDETESKCEYADRLGRVVDAKPAASAAMIFESASETADLLYRSGKKQEAARFVLQYLGSVGVDENVYLVCAMGGCEVEEGDARSLREQTEVQKRTSDKLRFFKFKSSDESEAPVYDRVAEWNNLGFYLAQAGYAEPAITILEWVRKADPDRKVAIKNLRDAKAIKSAKPIVFDVAKFELNQDTTIRNLAAFYKGGGQPVWHDDSIASAKILNRFKESDSGRHVFSTKSCDPNETRFDTLLHLALATGQTKTADWLWKHGFNDDLIDEADLWLAAAKRSQLASARWLVEHKIGIGDDDTLLAVLAADDVEIYKLWASVSLNARKQTDRFIYRFGIPPKIFAHLYKTRTISFTAANDAHPTLLSVLADSNAQIANLPEILRQIVDAGISPNVLNRSERRTALDHAIGKKWMRSDANPSEVEKTLRAIGAKTGKEVLAEGLHPTFTDEDFSPNAVAAFKKAAQP